MDPVQRLAIQVQQGAADEDLRDAIHALKDAAAGLAIIEGCLDRGDYTGADYARRHARDAAAAVRKAIKDISRGRFFAPRGVK